VATLLPILVLILTHDFDALASLYAIGVVGAITVNLGSCCFNRRLEMSAIERILMTLTAVISRRSLADDCIHDQPCAVLRDLRSRRGTDDPGVLAQSRGFADSHCFR
jgi:hypothetical protein